MNGRSRKWIGLASAVLLVLLSSAIAWHSRAKWDLPTDSLAAQRAPRIRPDYADVVIPPNIAPLDFVVEEPGVEYRVRIHGAEGNDIIIGSYSPSIVIPAQPWRQLLGQNCGRRIVFDVYAKDGEGCWSHFAPFSDEVAREEIDSHVAYRLLGPVCSLYRDMGLYQRDLESFSESPLLTTSESFDGCMNCHSFASHRPELFALQIRPGMNKKSVNGGLFVVRDSQAVKLKTQSEAAPQRPSYIAWHPSGRVIAFSMTKTQQIFHGSGAEMREGYDVASHLAIIHVETGAVATSPGIADTAMQEAFPCWSADGRTLFFCRAKNLWSKAPPRIQELKTVMYDLMRVKYDIEKNEVGPPETVLTAAETGLSIGEPRASPDGRYLLLTMAAHGNFFPFESSSDLYLLNLGNGKYRRLECNSDASDAWHCWSSNSRWIVFSSRRDVPLLSRLYFSYIDADGKASKPFLLPQKDASSYDSSLKVYNVPELISGPIAISQEKLLDTVHSADAESEAAQKPARGSGDSHPPKGK